MLTLKNSSLLELAVMLELDYLEESIDMKIVNVINQVKKDKMYDKFLDVWENLEQGDVVRVRYVNDRTDLKTKDYYYLVVKAPCEIGEECKYSFINLEKSAYRGSEINPFPLTEVAFRELFAYSSKTWATHRKPSNTLAISKFEVVEATLQVSHDRR